jgi:hypothetical protein
MNQRGVRAAAEKVCLEIYNDVMRFTDMDIAIPSNAAFQGL